MTETFTNISAIHFPVFVATWSTFFVAAVASFLLQVRLSGEQGGLIAFIKHCFPFGEWKRKSARMDVILYISSKFFKRIYNIVEFFITTFISLGVQALLVHLFPQHEPVSFGFFTIIACSIIVFIVNDFTLFYCHYLQHFVPVLWELHKVHHSATFLNVATTERLHPLANTFDVSCAATTVGVTVGVLGYIFGFSIPDTLVLLGNANLIGYIVIMEPLRHSHFPISFGRFDKYLLSPHMHQLHHSSQIEYWDKNFGNKLSVWDWLFGTAIVPQKNETFVYGLGKPEEEDYNKVFGAFLGPLVKIWHLIYREVDDPLVPSGKKRRFVFGSGSLWRSPDVDDYYPDAIKGTHAAHGAPAHPITIEPRPMQVIEGAPNQPA
jgi:sterol desaturase/sphingolipid hydroxylase (fatty acid hydroxylase superfamily)